MEKNCEIKIKSKLFSVRGYRGMLDRDLAELFGIETKVFNQSVKRHGKEFSEMDVFSLEKDDLDSLWSQNVTANQDINISKKSRSLPNFFTKTGIEKLSGILKKPTIKETNKIILDVFEKSSTDLIFPNSELKNKVLTYVSEDGSVNFDVKLENKMVWLTQQELALIFQTTQQNISYHIDKIYHQNELPKEATYKRILLVQKEGDRKINRPIDKYNLRVFIFLGFKIESNVARHFRQWIERVAMTVWNDGAYINEMATQDQLNYTLKEIQYLKEKNRMLEESHAKLLDQLPMRDNILGNIDLMNLLIQTKKKPQELSEVNCLIFCEGKTDVSYIQKAINLFSGTMDPNAIRFIIADGEKNLRKILHTYQNEASCPVKQTCLFIFDSDVSGVPQETKNNVITYLFQKKAQEKGYLYNRGIENNFHENVFLRLFNNDANYISLIKKISNTDEGKKETLIGFDFLKVSLCEALIKEGTKEDFIHFRGLVSLIAELVGETRSVSKETK